MSNHSQTKVKPTFSVDGGSVDGGLRKKDANKNHKWVIGL